MGEEEESKYGSKETEIPGPTSAKRGCRDILCIIIFLVVRPLAPRWNLPPSIPIWHVLHGAGVHIWGRGCVEHHGDRVGSRCYGAIFSS